MGIGIIAVGFLLLHFHFINAQILNVQLYPLYVSLPMIILGLLYSYRATKKKEYLCFVGACVLLIGLMFIDDMRVLFLTFQTLLYVAYLLFIRKEVPNHKHKKIFLIWIIVYTIFGFIRSWTVFGWHIGHEFNQIASIISIFSVIPLTIYLLRIRKSLSIEERPQIASINISTYIYILIIAISVLGIVLVRQPLTHYTNNQTNQFRIYQLDNEVIEPIYVIDWQSYDTYEANIIGDFYITSDINVDTIELEFNNYAMVSGRLNLINERTYDFSSDVNKQGGWSIGGDPKCKFKLNGQKIPTKMKEINPNEYYYSDSYIKISKCMIYDGDVLVMPRIEFTNKKIQFNSIQILDNNNQIIATKQIENDNQDYSDFINVCPESINSSLKHSDETIYQVRLIYTDQDKTIMKEYPLKLYENHMP